MIAIVLAALISAPTHRAASSQPASHPASSPVARDLPTVETTGDVCVAEVKASINPGSGAYMIESIDTAKRTNCGVLVITLDTPGGLLSTTRDIVKAILSAPLPVVVFVSPPGSVAGSAGVFITLSAHVAAMANGTNIGAAHPVSGGGKDVEAEGGKHMAEKVENDAVAWVESIATERGRNKEWAIKAVKESASITATTALSEHVIDIVARDLPDLTDQMDGRKVTLTDKIAVLKTKGKEVRKIGMSIAQRFTNAFADPQVAYILMSFGMLGIAMELYHPGAIFPGVVGSICLVMAFVSFQVLPINWGGVVLIILGFALFIAEAFITSHGLLGIGGGIAVVLGGLLLINTQDPDYFVQPNFALSWTQVVPLGVAIAGIAIFLATVVLRGKLAPIKASGNESLIGVHAKVRDKITPTEPGMVLLTGELWRASAVEPIDPGSDVVVERVDGLTVQVRRA